MKKFPYGRFVNMNVLYCILAGFVLSSCQIHKPVPVEHLSNVRSAAPIYDARRVPARSSVKSSTYNESANAMQAQWTPIHIQPLQVSEVEPTQPLQEYQFKPHPAAKSVANTTRYSTRISGGGNTRFHIVKRGESLYGIARSYGINVKTLAEYNDIYPPYDIYPQQKLSLGAPVSSSQVKAPVYSRPTKVTAPLEKVQTSLQWGWPVSGQLIESFNPGVSNGIEIAGQVGQTVRASADGTVLYSGNEVTGYGELVIIEHAQGYMTTYAHNRKLFVKQGEVVTRGQKIAEMGSSEADRTKLHFEIRKGEKPVDPIAYLPKR